jgi:hypothetical protein
MQRSRILRTVWYLDPWKWRQYGPIKTSVTNKPIDTMSHPRRPESSHYFMWYRNITLIKVSFIKSPIIMHFIKCCFLIVTISHVHHIVISDTRNLEIAAFVCVLQCCNAHINFRRDQSRGSKFEMVVTKTYREREDGDLGKVLFFSCREKFK